MIKITQTVLPSEMMVRAVIRGMRNPKNSWDNSDSGYFGPEYAFEVGDKDLTLMQTLSMAGRDHAKFRRMLAVYADI